MRPRFVDASVLLYAILNPRRELPEQLRLIKSNTRAIITRIQKGEKVITSIVHLSEVANILESRKSIDEVTQSICSECVSK